MGTLLITTMNTRDGASQRGGGNPVTSLPRCLGSALLGATFMAGGEQLRAVVPSLVRQHCFCEWVCVCACAREQESRPQGHGAQQLQVLPAPRTAPQRNSLCPHPDRSPTALRVCCLSNALQSLYRILPSCASLEWEQLPVPPRTSARTHAAA